MRAGQRDAESASAATTGILEIIQPVLDGNDRNRRELNPPVLANQDLRDQPVLHLSRYILRHRADYFRHLLAVSRESSWMGSLGFILTAVTDKAEWTTAKIQAIQRLHPQATAFIKTHASKTCIPELVDMLFTQPSCRIQNLVEADIIKRQTAPSYLKQLADLGMLHEIKVGREKPSIQPNFVRLLISDDHPVLPYGDEVVHV
jgi:Fic family protein